jgi:hypothetical protein
VQINSFWPLSCIGEQDANKQVDTNRVVGFDYHADNDYFLRGDSIPTSKIIVSTLNFFDNPAQGDWHLEFKQKTTQKTVDIQFGNGSLYIQGEGIH